MRATQTRRTLLIVQALVLGAVIAAAEPACAQVINAIICDRQTGFANTCTGGCTAGNLSDCPCYWDNPSTNPRQVFPNGLSQAGVPCNGFGQPFRCCYNPPCSAWNGDPSGESCSVASGGIPSDPTNARCEFDSNTQTCKCKPNLSTVPIPPVIDGGHTQPPPYDCWCDVPGRSADTRNDDCVQPLSACAAGKKLCVAKKVAALLQCYGKNEKPPKGLAPKLAECVQKATDKFDGGSKPDKGCFAKLEAKLGAECLTTNDAAALEQRVDVFVDEVVGALAGPPGAPTPLPTPLALSACAAGKKLCVAKKVAALLQCYGKNEKPPKGLARVKLDACVQKASDKFDGGSKPAKGCFARLEAKLGAECRTSGDSAALAEQADTFVYETLHALVDPSAQPARTPVPTPRPTPAP